MVHDASGFVKEKEHDLVFILTSAGAENIFNKTSRDRMLRQTSIHAPLLIRLVNALHSKGEPYLRLGEELIIRKEGTH